MTAETRKIILRDSTLREAMDVPGVSFSLEQRVLIARELFQTGVAEAEVVAPARVISDLRFAKAIKESVPGLALAGLVYGFKGECSDEISAASGLLDRFEIIMPASIKRRPFEKKEKKRLLKNALSRAVALGAKAGAGFPQSFQAEPELLEELSRFGFEAGADRITVYDTNGSADPFQVSAVIKRVKSAAPRALVFFHGHNDLGMATANSLSAVMAGADGLDVTVNGLGDRAGNASLEQTATLLHLRGFESGVKLERLAKLSETISRESGVNIYALAPIVGEYSFSHKSPAHLESPELFEPLDPAVVGLERKIYEG
jgi:homocitrate synthase NifV